VRSIDVAVMRLAEEALQRSFLATSSPPGSPLWNQPEWYVDPIGGSDGNTGATSGSPVKTVNGGIIAKWGTSSPAISIPMVKILFMNPQAFGVESIWLSPINVQSGTTIGFITIEPYSTAGTPFTLNVVTVKNRAARTLLTASAPPGASGGLTVFNLTRGSSAMITIVSEGVMTMCQPLISEFGLFFEEDDTWATGDSCELFAPPLVNLTGAWGDGVYVTNMHVPDPTGTPGAGFISVKSSVFQQCRLDSYHYQRGYGSSSDYVGCWSNPLISAQSEASIEMAGECSWYGGYNPNGFAFTALSAAFSLGQDAILGGVTTVTGAQNSTFINYVYLLPDSALFIGEGGINELDGILWGPGAFGVQTGGMVWIPDGNTWVDSLLQTGGTTIDGLATGSYYDASTGTWTGNVSVTPANLDANGGLMNPMTGSRLVVGI
jgi:hypothetical protein